jgi:hypothetical protein
VLPGAGISTSLADASPASAGLRGRDKDANAASGPAFDASVTGNPAVDAGTQSSAADASTGTPPADASTPKLSCEVQWSADIVQADNCPASPPASRTPCSSSREVVCAYPDPNSTPDNPSIVIAACGSPMVNFAGWLTSAFGCRASCPPSPAPDPGSTVVEFDTTSCDARPLQPCVAAVTQPVQLYNTLMRFVTDHQLSIPSHRTLWVEFENGCPRRAFVPSASGDVAAIQAALGSVRWECALELSCAGVAGPNTL